MIHDAISLIRKELVVYLAANGYSPESNADTMVVVENIALLESNSPANLDDKIVFTLVNIEEESTLKNVPYQTHVKPDLFDSVIESKLNDSGNFPKIGGVRGKNARTFLPTGETLLFLLAGEQLLQRLQVQQLFGSQHLFAKKKILWLEELPAAEPRSGENPSRKMRPLQRSR